MEIKIGNLYVLRTFEEQVEAYPNKVSWDGNIEYEGEKGLFTATWTDILFINGKIVRVLSPIDSLGQFQVKFLKTGDIVNVPGEVFRFGVEDIVSGFFEEDEDDN